MYDCVGVGLEKPMKASKFTSKIIKNEYFDLNPKR